MTDLRKAAQAVLDSHVFGQVGHNAIQALRQALAEPVEPVAWMTHHDEPMLFPTEAEALSFCDDDETPISLYTTPPSVDALIAEAVAKEREACAQVCIAFGKTLEDNNGENYAEEIRARGQK